MTYIIAEPCVGVCDTACVEVCPVDCIYFTKDKDIGEEAKAEGFEPEEYIDCGACEPECPVEAIFEETEVPAEWDDYIRKNYEFFGQQVP